MAAGEPGEEGAAGQTLEVDDEVEILAANALDTFDQGTPMERGGPALAIKGIDTVQLGIILEEGGEFGSDPPIDLMGWIMVLEQAENRQSLDDISEGTRFKNEDFQPRLLAQSEAFGQAFGQSGSANFCLGGGDIVIQSPELDGAFIEIIDDVGGFGDAVA